MDNRPIGVFDSGVGGLTVTRELMRVLPKEELVYFGDTARVPYGSKSRETVTRFSLQDVRFLLSKNVKAVVVACNTASANSLSAMQQAFALPIFGVVEPGAAAGARATKNGRIGVIATSSTIASGAYQQEILKKNRAFAVLAKACPLFVPLVEEGWTEEEVTFLTAQKYLTELKERQVDTLVMGCTHYPLLRRCIQEVMGPAVTLIDPARETALLVKEALEEKQLLRQAGTPPVHRFFVSDQTAMFESICRRALGEVHEAEKIEIESY